MKRSKVIGALTLGFLAASAALASAPPTADQWEEGSSEPGAELSFLDRGAHEAENGKLVVAYEFRVFGLPQDRLYELWLRRLDGSTRPTHSLRIDDHGGLVLDTSGAQLVLAFGGMMAGEPNRVLLRSDDGQVWITRDLVAMPLASTDGECKVSLQMITTDRSFYQATLSGFERGEQIRAVSRSQREVVEFTVEVAEDDKNALILAPAVDGMDGGWASLSLFGASCSVSIEYPWGTAAETL